MTEPRLLSILIPAVGGQGGGVLMEWIHEAALHAGLGAHGTSIPGVAQRTGSTTYYLEIFDGGGGPALTVSLYPVPGAVDVLLAPELLEVGRMIELGFPSPGRTTIVTSTHRLYSIHEKMALGRGVYPTEALESAARQFSRRLVAFDALAAASRHRTEANAVLLGALAASACLPIPRESYRAAIEGRGVAVESNLRGFEVGFELVAYPEPAAAPEPPPPPAVPPRFVEAVQFFPESCRDVVARAVARLIDYQNEDYADRFLGRLAPLVRRDASDLPRLVARYLAVWMTYEDAIRVADLKTRRSRFERIRAEARADGAEIIVTDYLKPDLDELYGILPYRLVAPFARWAERRWPQGRPTLGQHVRTTTVLGFLRVWLLARLRFLRPSSYRAHHENARMDHWLGVVKQAAQWDDALACELARAAQLVKGYGDVRRRMAATFDHLLETVMRAGTIEADKGLDFAVSTALAAAYRTLVLSGPDGETRAPAVAAEVMARLEANDRDAALASIDRAAA
ncbi:MAG: indolepyruvate oxidoreductase subunit beta family protein [Candidatus Rokubacteria bacterium]|nr:indolepyruvate oxidoreductase subunit beta family protein [Candidatus Rokubacteria bacterium]MBI3824733.1 indolepyruvate oxidoreductase subunit beta family protein [Candidatus Rokubacteria bacterium]